MNIFVTGFHRAGSKTIAKYLANKHNLVFVEEHLIDLWDFRRVTALTNGFVYDTRTKQLVFIPAVKEGFVLQCPFLSHKALDLAWYGKVYWADRNHVDIITSMKNGSFKEDALFIIKQFVDEFPDDPYWATARFPIERDVPLTTGDKLPQPKTPVTDNWMGYYKLVVDVKKHFLETKFKDSAEVIRLEDLPIYDPTKHLSGKKPLEAWELDAIRN